MMKLLKDWLWNNMYYLDLKDVLLIHNEILKKYWWLAWVKDEQQIWSVLQHIQNDEYYKWIIEKSCHLFFWIIKFHCFNDWNKRTSIWVLSIFWETNNINIPDLFVKLEDIAIWVAKWEITKEELRIIFKSIFISFSIEVK